MEKESSLDSWNPPRTTEQLLDFIARHEEKADQDQQGLSLLSL